MKRLIQQFAWISTFPFFSILSSCQNDPIPQRAHDQNNTVVKEPPQPLQPDNSDARKNAKPLLGFKVTSPWCEKRSVGTCPHVGVDAIPSDGNVNSYAISNGVVEDIQSVGSCGHASHFRDNQKALWRYLHVATPKYSKGQKLFLGELVGNWYGGNSSCVTGPHLHLERLEPGGYGGEKKGGNQCGTGYRNCNYDPLTPLKIMQDLKDESTRKAAVAAAKANSSSFTALYSSTSTGTSTSSCQGKQLSDFPLRLDDIGGSDAGEKEVVIQVRAQLEESGAVRLQVEAKLAQDGKGNNECQDGASCIASWEILVKTPEGSARVASALGTQNRPVRIITEALCVGDLRSVPWEFRATTDKGMDWVLSGSVEL